MWQLKPYLHIYRHSVLQLRTSKTCLSFPCVKTLLFFPPWLTLHQLPMMLVRLFSAVPFPIVSPYQVLSLSSSISTNADWVLHPWSVWSGSLQTLYLMMKKLGHRKKTGPRWYSQVTVVHSVHHNGHFSSTKYLKCESIWSAGILSHLSNGIAGIKYRARSHHSLEHTRTTTVLTPPPG